MKHIILSPCRTALTPIRWWKNILNYHSKHRISNISTFRVYSGCIRQAYTHTASISWEYAKSYLSNTYSSLFKFKQIIHRRSNSRTNFPAPTYIYTLWQRRNFTHCASSHPTIAHSPLNWFRFLFSPDFNSFTCLYMFWHTFVLYIHMYCALVYV